jgi:hypothetical protein
MDLKILQDTPPWDWPRGIGQKFLSILRDPKAKASDRLLAADLAGDFTVINDPLAHALLAIVGNAAEPEELRAAAAISLGPALEQADIDEFDDPESVPISEKTFHKIQQSLRKVYDDSGVPKFVRRRILEAAVRAPEDWHTDAIRSAYASPDPEWKLTAVFGMRHVRGFDEQIVEALESPDPLIHYEAVCAAGVWEIDAAWPHVVALLAAPGIDKDLLIAAMQAVAGIRPREARALLVDLADSEDEDIADAADEAMAEAEGLSDHELEDDDEFAGEDDDDDDEDDEEENDETIH